MRSNPTEAEGRHRPGLTGTRAALSVWWGRGAVGRFHRLVFPGRADRIGSLHPGGMEFSGSAYSRKNHAFLVRSAPGAAPRMETEWPRMTVDSLKDCNKKFLAQMAKDQGIVGWHAMRKDQLIRALSPPAAPRRSRPARPRRRRPWSRRAASPPRARRPPRRAARSPSCRPGRSITPASRTGSSPWSATRTGSTPTGS